MFEISAGGRTFAMEALSDDCLISKRAWAQGAFYEEKLLNQIRHNAQPGVFVDCGAHLGNHSIYFASFTKATKVIAVEAVAEMFDILSRNIAHNCDAVRVRLVHAAAYSVTGQLLFHRPPHPLNTGSTRMSGSREVRGDWGSTITTRIDDVIDDADHVSLIKIDTEGCEPAVITGARQTIERCHPMIVAEAKTRAEQNAVQRALGSRYRIRIRTTKPGTYIWTWQ